MKSLITALVLVLVAHVLCSGSCISASLKTTKTTEAPCHKQDDEPSQQESRNLCSQTQVTESKSGGAGNHVVQVSAVLPQVPFLLAPIDPLVWSKTSDKASGTSILSAASTILRI